MKKLNLNEDLPIKSPTLFWIIEDSLDDIISKETDDCNFCSFLSLTEIEQRKMENGNLYPHICKKYNDRVFHYSQNKNHYMLYPCKKCLEEREKNVIAE